MLHWLEISDIKGKGEAMHGRIKSNAIYRLEKEEMYVDSGATDTVCPKEFAPGTQLRETKGITRRKVLPSSK